MIDPRLAHYFEEMGMKTESDQFSHLIAAGIGFALMNQVSPELLKDQMCALVDMLVACKSAEEIAAVIPLIGIGPTNAGIIH